MKRVIPILLIKDEIFVKTKNFNQKRYLGDIINAIRIFNEKQVDEICILDISASINRKGPNFSILEDIISECFMPVSYGGGINNIKDADKLFKIGVEKLIFNQSIINENFTLFNRLTTKYGNQSIVASINLKRTLFGKVKVYDYLKKKFIKTSIQNHLKLIESLGFGEILITDVDQEGTLSGKINKALINEFAKTRLPLIYNGGISSDEQIQNLLDEIDFLDALGVGARFVFQGPHNAVLINYYNYKQ